MPICTFGGRSGRMRRFMRSRRQWSKVLEVAPIHCAGYRKRQLEKYVQKDVMGYLHARFGITFFADEIRLEPMECPLEECPWRDRLASSQNNHLTRAEVTHG
ncbi:MAG: hypothetical protein WA901_06240, partial [Phormidesmis sp.]